MYSARDHASRDRIHGRGGDAAGEAGYDAIHARARTRCVLLLAMSTFTQSDACIKRANTRGKRKAIQMQPVA